MKERSPAEVVRLVKDEGIEVVDLRFCDLPGLMQHFSIPAHTLTEEISPRATGSTARPSAASSRSTSPT